MRLIAILILLAVGCNKAAEFDGDHDTGTYRDAYGQMFAVDGRMCDCSHRDGRWTCYDDADPRDDGRIRRCVETATMADDSMIPASAVGGPEYSVLPWSAAEIGRLACAHKIVELCVVIDGQRHRCETVHGATREWCDAQASPPPAKHAPRPPRP